MKTIDKNDDIIQQILETEKRMMEMMKNSKKAIYKKEIQ